MSPILFCSNLLVHYGRGQIIKEQNEDFKFVIPVKEQENKDAKWKKFEQDAHENERKWKKKRKQVSGWAKEMFQAKSFM